MTTAAYRCLAAGDRLRLSPIESAGTREWVISGVEGRGGSAVCYRAHCGNKSGRLKEFYPQDQAVFLRGEDNLPVAVAPGADKLCREFCRAYDTLEQYKSQDAGAELLNNFLPAYEILRGGDTVYIWTPDDKQGVSFEHYLHQAWKDPDRAPEHKLYNILHTVLTLTDCVRVFHRAGLLHLDIKPDNFLVLYDGQFNISPSHISLFDINTLCPMDGSYRIMAGTEGYFAPEVPRGKADNRSDIYSIGAMLLRALADPDVGKYRKELYPMLDQLMATSPLLQASRINENVFLRHVLGGILKKCLAARPADRYTCCEELMTDLEQAITFLLPQVAGKKLGTHKRLVILDAEPQDNCDPAAVIHDLLFRHPVDRHLLPDQKTLKVLVLGAGTYGQKFLDICLQAGQLPGRSLHIKALSQRPQLDREVYLQIRPALPEFVDCGGFAGSQSYARLEFLPMELEKDTFVQLEAFLKDWQPHFAFISSGDDRRNQALAHVQRHCCENCDVHFVTTSRETVQSRWGNPVYIYAPVTPKTIHPLLQQMAFHTHLSWMDGENPDLTAARQQFRKKYNYHASLAYALSVRGKLRSLGICEEDPRKAAEAFCDQVLNMPGEAFCQLVAMEHRRWVLEKITSGWRQALDLAEGIARGRMRDDLHKTHPCILLSEANMPLAHFTRQQWDVPGPWDEALDPLDLLSVTQHRLCLEDAARLHKSQPLQTGEVALIRRRLEQAPENVKAAFEDYQLCLKQILQGDFPAAGELTRYETTLQHTFAVLSPARRKELTTRLRQVRTEFFPAIEACLYRDYKAQDAILIHRIPYILDPENPAYRTMGRLSEL